MDNLSGITMRDYENWDVNKLSEHLAKYIKYKDNCYSLIIHKNDWDGDEERSWIVYYAKENKISFSTEKVLIKVSGSTLHVALINMLKAYFQFKNENRNDPNYQWKL